MAGADARAARDLARKLCRECVECGVSLVAQYPSHARECSHYADELTRILHQAYAPIRKKMFPQLTTLMSKIGKPRRDGESLYFEVKHDKG